MLANEPFLLPIDYIKTLTPYQITSLYLCDRGEHGEVLPPRDPEARYMTQAEKFEAWRVANKLKTYQAKRIWDRIHARSTHI